MRFVGGYVGGACVGMLLWGALWGLLVWGLLVWGLLVWGLLVWGALWGLLVWGVYCIYISADDMGLGKTLSLLALVVKKKQDGSDAVQPGPSEGKC